MKVVNFGSLNIDHVYRVEHFLKPGETLCALNYAKNAGGKGLNQSIAFSRAGAEVYHAGLIGEDGLFLKELLQSENVNVELVSVSDAPTGHAIIQVDTTGQNCILVESGTNGMITDEHIDRVFSSFKQGDYAVFQNELNCLDKLLAAAKNAGLKTVLNPSPINDTLLKADLSGVDYFIVNEHEGAALTGKTEPSEMLDEFLHRYPGAGIVLTLGTAGAYYADASCRYFEPAVKVKAVDTTAAGDTFTGYFFASLLQRKSPDECLKLATTASSVTVTRPGAAASIPYAFELIKSTEPQ